MLGQSSRMYPAPTHVFLQEVAEGCQKQGQPHLPPATPSRTAYRLVREGKQVYDLVTPLRLLPAGDN